MKVTKSKSVKMTKVISSDDFLNYLDRLYEVIKDGRLMDELVRSKIIEKINGACEITKINYADLLKGLDFKKNDLTMEYLESFLAELRSIFWLRDFVFTEIVPLQAKKKKIQPDFSAKYGEKIFAVEVFCLTQKHEQKKDQKYNVYINFDPGFNGSKFGRDFISQAKKKKVQLDAHNVDAKILLCVVNSSPMIALNKKNDFDSHVKFLYESLNWGNGYYLGLLTGVCDINGISNDTIYPRLTN